MNRNKLIIINALIVIITTLSNIVLGMIEIKLFLSVYGEQLNGLIQTGNQVLGYLSLIESGLCAAYVYKLYKPIAVQDDAKISSLYKGFISTMNKVVIKMLLGASVISVIYPIVINDKSIRYINMASIFILLSFKYITPYWLTLVPQNMIILKEQKYKVELINGINKIMAFLVEIIILLTWKPKIEIVLLMNILVTLIISLWFKNVMRRLYKGQIDNNATPCYEPTSMSKDLLVHNISSLAFSSTDNIVISIFGNLNQVFIYSSYNLVASQIASVFQRIIDGTSATIGIKLSKDISSSYEIYSEIVSGTLFLAAFITSSFVVIINPFVELWIGPKYVLSNLDVCLFGGILYANIVLPALYVARNAKGLYKESRNFTVVQAVLNLSITFILVPKIGITGALLGTMIARYAISIPKNYNLVYSRVFPKLKKRGLELLGNICVMLMVTMLLLKLRYMFVLIKLSRGLNFIFSTIIIIIISLLIFTIYFYVVDKNFKRLIKRIVGMF